jgi:galactose-1-phosphate uridylyltransferase
MVYMFTEPFSWECVFQTKGRNVKLIIHGHFIYIADLSYDLITNYTTYVRRMHASITSQTWKCEQYMLINHQRKLRVFAEFVFVTVRASFWWKFSKSVSYAFTEDVRFETVEFIAAILLTIQLFWYRTLCLWAMYYFVSIIVVLCIVCV